MAVEAKQEEYATLDLDFQLNKKDILQTKELYCSQCANLKHREQQMDLWRTLAIARKNDLPLLPLVIDSFTRDRVDYFLKHNKPLSLQKWATNYPTLKTLTKETKYHQMIQSAISTFCHRYAPLMQLPVIERYDDSLEAFTDYIVEATSLIKILLDADGVSPPFQVDMMIIPRKVVQSNGDNDSDTDEEEFDSDFDSDEDSDEESESENDDADDEKKNKNDAYSQIGDIKTKLTENKIMYQHTVTADGRRNPRMFHNLFAELKSKTKQKQKQQQFQMPHKERFCIVIDRRKGPKSNEVFMYKPNLLSDLPFKDHVEEWYFESSLSCILPGKYQSDRITAKTSAKGYVFCLSFQVEERNSIKAYMYTRSQMVRFLPDDICNLLPHLFIANDNNRTFIEKEKKSQEYSQNIKLIDTRFDKFRAQTSKSALKSMKKKQKQK